MQSVTECHARTYAATPSSVAEARAAVAAFAAEAGASPAQVDDIRLAASEAVTNAVLHAYRGEPGPIHVTAALAGRELWLLVADEGGGMQPQADRPGLGLGLGLISQVSDDMAIVPRAAGGVEVRIRFRLAGALKDAVRPPRRRQSQRPPAPGGHGAPPATAMALDIPGPVSLVPAAPLHD